MAGNVFVKNNLFDVQLVFDYFPVLPLQKAYVFSGNGQRGKRQPVAQIFFFADEFSGRAQILHKIHFRHQPVVGFDIRQQRIVGKMNRSFGINQRLINMFGGKGHQRRQNFAQIDQHRVEHVKSLPVARPEAVAAAADVPVVQNLHKRRNFVAGMRHVISVEPFFDFGGKHLQTRQNIPVKRIFGRCDFFGAVALGIGIEGEKVKSVPERNLRHPRGLDDFFAFLINGQIAAFQDRGRNQKPAQSVGADFIEHHCRIGVVFQPLGELLPAFGHQQTGADAVLKRRLVVQSR